MARVSRSEPDQDRSSGQRFYTDRIVQRIGDRRITLYRRGDVADSSWYFCVYLREEGRQYRVSLRTAVRDEAKRKAETVLINLLGRVRNGEKILSPSLDDVLLQFKRDQQQRVKEGRLSAKTVALQGYRIKLGLEFLATHYPAGIATKITAVDGEIFKKYLAWRKEKRALKGADKTIRLDVIRDELLSIRKVFLFARDQKLCSDRSIPTWDFAVEKESSRRKRVSKDDYIRFIRCIKQWRAKATSPKDRYHRELLHHFVLVVSNTGLRTGELIGLKNRDVQVRSQANECLITVRAETSKVRRGRDITVNQSFGGHPNRTNGINYLIRWIEKYQVHKEPNDYVFAPFDSGKKEARNIYYHYYKNLRGDLRVKGLEWFDTYHCRHFWITNRLYAGEPIHLVARAAGTSTDEIEKTYSNVLTELATRQFGKNRVIYRPDGSYYVAIDRAERAPPAEASK